MAARGRNDRNDRSGEPGRVQRAIATAIGSGEMISVGALNLVKTTLVTGLSGARDVGAEIGGVGVAAVRGSVRAASDIGGDLGMVAKGAIKGTLLAVEEIGGDLGAVARSAARAAVKTAGDVGGDAGRVARRAVEGSVEAARELTCEETTAGLQENWGQPHGYVFAVPLNVERGGLEKAAPIRALGRFSHEGVAVDQTTGIVYLTEDPGSGAGAGFYRFLPDDPLDLHAGGTLQMLGIAGQPTYDTREGQTLGAVLPVVWFDTDDPDPENPNNSRTS